MNNQPQDPLIAAIRSGNAFFSSTGRVEGVAGNLRLTLVNPANSKKRIFIHRIVMFAVAISWAKIRINPTSGLPAATSTKKVQNKVLASNINSVATLRADVDPLIGIGGGVDTGIAIPIPANIREPVDFHSLIIDPGNTFGLNVSPNTTADSLVTLYWWEETI